MPTEKLYYQDAYMSEFTGLVTGCTPVPNGWQVTLAATAFYPLGGGQAADTGTLGEAHVLDVREQGEEVVHLCDKPLAVGQEVPGHVDWALRFDRMQQHSGEHILSGIIHRHLGLHNTGFHMGAELVTVDFDGPISNQELERFEAEANRAVWENLPVKCWYPTPEELPGVAYRTKRALDWPVRIVEVPGYDRCACCGTHVARTGEIGLIKIFSSTGFHGGVRLEMACGERAYRLMNRVFQQNRLVSQALSAKIFETGAAAEQIKQALADEKFRSVGLERQVFAAIAESYVNQNRAVHISDPMPAASCRSLADAISKKCGEFAAVFAGSDGAGYNFCIIGQPDLRPMGKALTAALHGRGGGRPDCQQGSLTGTKAEILEFFRTWNAAASK